MADGRLIHVDVTKSVGAIEIGTIFSIFMLGILTSQVYYYFRRFWRTDGVVHRLLVGIIWSLEMSNTGGACYEVYRATITHYGLPQKLTTFPGLASGTATGASVTLLVHGFFCHRLVRVLPRPYSYIGYACFALSTVRFAAAVFLCNYAMHVTNLAHYAGHYGWLISSLLAVGAGIDVVIAASMLWYLKHKRRESFERVAIVIDKLMEYTVRSGAFTCLWAVILLIIFQSMPGDWAWLAVYMVLTKLYSTSLLSTLNSRVEIRDKLASASMPSVEHTSKHRGNRLDPRSSHFNFTTSKPISIEMNTTTRTIHDEPDHHHDVEKRLDSSGNIKIVTPYLHRNNDSDSV